MRTRHLRILLLLAGAMLCSLSLSAQTDITKPPRPQKQQTTTTRSNSSTSSSSSSQQTTTTPTPVPKSSSSSSSSSSSTSSSSSSQQTTTTPTPAPKPTSGYINGHEWVDLGLSVKWATCNVGSSRPSGYGNYYAWGETRTKSTYTDDNSVTRGKQMGSIAGNPKYDAARANWGGTWRLPTASEIDELINKCQRVWTTLNGVYGCKITGPNGNSIFLPAAGYRFESWLELARDGCCYWSATPNEDNTLSAYVLGFRAGGFYSSWVTRSNGRPVRPVSE